MANQDWDKFGEDIRRTVQEAIDSRNYNRLNQTITNTVNSAMNTVGKSLHDVGNVVDKTARNFQNPNHNHKRTYRGTYGYQHRSGRDGYTGETPYGEEDDGGDSQYTSQYDPQHQPQGNTRGHVNEYSQYNQADGTVVSRAHQSLFVRTTGTKAGGMAMAIAGYVLGIAMLLVFLFSMIGIAVTPHAVGIGIMFFAILAAILFIGGASLAGIGTSLLGKVKRYQFYLTELGTRDYCEVKELSEKLKKPHKYVVKDLERMIRSGWFRQGHLDNQRTCLIVSNDAFAQYNALMERMAKQEQEEKRTEESQAKKQEKMDPRVQEVMQAGDAYIKKIRECNDAIPGEEISAKISRMEVLVNRIFERVEQNPESVTEIRRLMEYYLPTTVKLLEAYQELDATPVQGENIISSKKEIEQTLDTLNLAFEKLLDSLFQDTAWNVAADISVLNTMLAQEGLTKEDFKK